MKRDVINSNESYSLIRHWEVEDIIEYDSGHRELARPIDHNMVVDTCSVAIAGLMKGDRAMGPIKYWAIGSGQPTWGEENQPSPVKTQARLFTETMRKVINPENIVYLDDHGQPTVEKTNRIEITVTFEKEEGNGPLREFGLFAGAATSSPNSGTMINHKTHKVIHKTTDFRLIRKIRITF